MGYRRICSSRITVPITRSDGLQVRIAGDQATGLAILGNLATEKPWRAALDADRQCCSVLLNCVEQALHHELPLLQQKAANLLSNTAAAAQICQQVTR